MDINRFITSLKAFQSQFYQIPKETLRDSSEKYMFAIKSIAPIDSGDFKESWNKEVVNENDSELSISFSNYMPYSFPIEFGSSPGSKPWPNVGPKTIMSNGRIFSSQAPNGTINKVFNEDNITKLAQDMAEKIVMIWRHI